MNVEEQKKLENTISGLISSANSFKEINDFFNNDSRMKPIYQIAITKCCNDGCHCVASIMISVIKDLLNTIDNLLDEEEE